MNVRKANREIVANKLAQVARVQHQSLLTQFCEHLFDLW
jgi:hypothetical protein